MSFLAKFLSDSLLLFVVIVFILFFIYLLKWIFIKVGYRFFKFVHSLLKSIIPAIENNPDVKNLIRRYPKIWAFLKKHFNRSRLPATFLFIAFIYLLFLFGGVVESVITSDVIASADIRVANLLYYYRNPVLVDFFLWITILGKWQIVLVFFVATVVVLLLRRAYQYIVPLIITISGSLIFAYIGKIAFHRARPLVAIYTEDSFSFPSGHATAAVAFYGFLMYIALRYIRRWRYRVDVIFAGCALIMLLGLSRMYLGVHYLSDVWAGYLLGSLWLIIGIRFSEHHFSYWKSKSQIPLTKNKSWFSYVAVGVAMCVYVFFALNYEPLLFPIMSERNEGAFISDINGIFQNESLRYTETFSGMRLEPLSFVILAKNDEVFKQSFTKAGWFSADHISLNSTIKMFRSVVFKESYATAPITPAFWDLNIPDFGFQKPTEANNLRTRHHARFWKTNYVTTDEYNVYVGTASFDDGIKWFLVHQIDPNIDSERDFLLNDLLNSTHVASYKKEKIVQATLGKNLFGDQFFTDGYMYVITMK